MLQEQLQVTSSLGPVCVYGWRHHHSFHTAITWTGPGHWECPTGFFICQVLIKYCFCFLSMLVQATLLNKLKRAF